MGLASGVKCVQRMWGVAARHLTTSRTARSTTAYCSQAPFSPATAHHPRGSLSTHKLATQTLVHHDKRSSSSTVIHPAAATQRSV